MVNRTVGLCGKRYRKSVVRPILSDSYRVLLPTDGHKNHTTVRSVPFVHLLYERQFTATIPARRIEEQYERRLPLQTSALHRPSVIHHYGKFRQHVSHFHRIRLHAGIFLFIDARRNQRQKSYYKITYVYFHVTLPHKTYRQIYYFPKEEKSFACRY